MSVVETLHQDLFAIGSSNEEMLEEAEHDPSLFEDSNFFLTFWSIELAKRGDPPRETNVGRIARVEVVLTSDEEESLVGVGGEGTSLP